MTSKESTISILDYLPASCINIDLKSQTKKEVLKELVTLLSSNQKMKNPEKVLKTLQDREELGSTGIGQGVAIPHGKSDDCAEIQMAVGLSKKGIEFNALDGEPVHLFFLLIAPQNSTGTHLKILAKISRLLKDKFFRQALKESKSPEEVLKQIQDENEY